MIRKTLLTPGPANTSVAVKAAMMQDFGSREPEFISIVGEVRRSLLDLVQTDNSELFEAILLQGSGTFAMEAALVSTIPDGGELLVVSAGTYAERIVEIAERHRIRTHVIRHNPHTTVRHGIVKTALRRTAITHVAMVHGETSTGAIYPLKAIGRIVREEQRCFIVDAIGTFGAVSIQMEAFGIDFLVASSNKCLQSAPGLAFVLAGNSAVQRYIRPYPGLALDLHDQLREFQKSGEFRFTPPTHVVLALREALHELKNEGGVQARGSRYRRLRSRLTEGMKRLGFKTYLPATRQGPTVTAFCYPRSSRFSYERFSFLMSENGYVIYPAFLEVQCFRVGTIGDLDDDSIDGFLSAVQSVLQQMGVRMRRTSRRTINAPS